MKTVKLIKIEANKKERKVKKMKYESNDVSKIIFLTIIAILIFLLVVAPPSLFVIAVDGRTKVGAILDKDMSSPTKHQSPLDAVGKAISEYLNCDSC